VELFMATLNVADTVVFTATPVPLFAGLVELTVGAVGGGLPPPPLLFDPPEHPAISTTHESKKEPNRKRIPALLPDSIAKPPTHESGAAVDPPPIRASLWRTKSKSI
jgi:hypothetical protein